MVHNRVSRNNKDINLLCMILILGVLFCLFSQKALKAETLDYCSTGGKSYTGGFIAEDFDQVENMDIESDKLMLNTGFQAIDTEHIIIPSTQHVYVDFVFEDASANHRFGWFSQDDLTDSNGDGTPDDSDGDGIPNDLDVNGAGGVPNFIQNHGHTIFAICDDDTDTSKQAQCPTNDLCSTNDGAPDYNLDRDGINCESNDYVVDLGEIEGGKEIVFYLIVYYNSGGHLINTYFSKAAYNQDPVCGDLPKTIKIGKTIDQDPQGWITNTAKTRIFNRYGLFLPADETKTVDVPLSTRMQHLLVAAPQDEPNVWILGWEDLYNGGDEDYNDLVFKVTRETGGIIKSKVVSSVDIQDNDMTIISVTFSKIDNVPEGTSIVYSISINQGTTWVELEFPDGQNTVTVDFSDMDMVGDKLIWMCTMTSPEESKIPEITSVDIEYEALAHGFYTHSSPILLSNMLYMGVYETPQSTWSDARYRGHFYAYRFYDYNGVSGEYEQDNTRIWDAGLVLADKGNWPPDQRTIYTILNGSKVSFDCSNLTSPMVNLGFSWDHMKNGVMVDDLDHDDDVDDNDAQWLIEWVRGYADGTLKNNQKDWKLGAIDHSTPAVIGPPGVPDWYYGLDITKVEKEGYDQFKTSMAARDTVAYIGARDGMLHAFDAGENRTQDNPDTPNPEYRGYFAGGDYGDGHELWAFIPHNLLDKLRNNYLHNTQTNAMVDASPSVADVKIGDSWHTVLICAQGSGGPYIFALDITNPGNPLYMWEFTDSDLGNSRSSPPIGNVRFSDGSVKWITVFASGVNVANDDYGYVYIVDVATGSLLQDTDGNVIGKIALDCGDHGNGISGNPVLVDADGNGFRDRLYVGDKTGKLYRINLPSRTKCVLADIGQPIYASPVVSVENASDTTVFFGTGDDPEMDDLEAENYYFYSYKDTAPNDCCSAASMIWQYALPGGEKVWASAYASAGHIYFGTSTGPTQSICSADGSNPGKTYTADVDPLKSEETGELLQEPESVSSEEIGNVVSSPRVYDEHLFVTIVDGKVTLYGSGTYNNAPATTEYIQDIKILNWKTAR